MIFLNDWEDSKLAGMIEDFDISEKDLEGYQILLADYTYESYNGEAFVLLKKESDGTLYEVNGGHCSCYGLEGQWDLEETTVESIKHRITEGSLCVYKEYLTDL